MALEAAVSKEPMKERTSGVDWAEVLRRTFDFDVLSAPFPCPQPFPHFSYALVVMHDVALARALEVVLDQGHLVEWALPLRCWMPPSTRPRAGCSPRHTVTWERH